MTIIDELSLLGIVPVVAIDDPKRAAPLSDALCNGGLTCAEVTFRTDAAEEAIRIMTAFHPDMIVGAGTVLTTDQADRAAVLCGQNQRAGCFQAVQGLLVRVPVQAVFRRRYQGRLRLCHGQHFL